MSDKSATTLPEQVGPRELRDRLFTSKHSEAFELVIGEPNPQDVASRVLDRWTSGAWAHASTIEATRKFAKLLASTDFRGHNKYMTTTAAQNTAHRTDAVWIKTGKQVKVNGENYISEYRNVFTGQAIRKDWRMTGCDWIIFDADDNITGRAYSLTFAKYEAGE